MKVRASSLARLLSETALAGAIAWAPVHRDQLNPLKGLTEGVEAEGWRFVALARLVPLFPFNLLNYALGLTRIRLSQYVVASGSCRPDSIGESNC